MSTHKNYFSCFSYSLLFSFVFSSITANNFYQNNHQNPPAIQDACGGTGTDIFSDVVATADGGNIAVGRAVNIADEEQEDIYVVKWTADGTIEWSKLYGGAADDKGNSIVQTTDGGYFIVGNTKSVQADREDIYVLKISNAGGLEWSNTFEGTTVGTGFSTGVGLEATDGSGYMIGAYGNNFGAGIRDIFVIKIDLTGTLVWSRAYGEDSNDWITGMTATADGGYVMVGSSASFPRFGFHDVLVTKIDANGDLMWTKNVGTNLNDFGRDVVEDANGDLLIAAEYSNGSGGFSSTIYSVVLIKMSASGDLLWTKSYAGGMRETVVRMRATADDHYVIVGRSNSFSTDGMNDAMMLKVNTMGDVVSSKTYGGEEDEFFSGVGIQADAYFFAGNTTSFGTGDLDTYYVRTDTDGELENSCFDYVVNFTTTDITSQIRNVTLVSNNINMANPISTTVTDYELPCYDVCNAACPDDLYLPNTVREDIYRAENTISSDGTVEAMTNVSFLTGTCISLLPDFEVVLGAEFLAQTNMPCSQNSVTTVIDRTGHESPEERMIFEKNMDLKVHPNPFASSTRIDYTLQQDEKISLHLMDTNGRVLRTLVSAEWQKTGLHTLDLPRESLVAGVYFLIMDTQWGKQTWKLVVL